MHIGWREIPPKLRPHPTGPIWLWSDPLFLPIKMYIQNTSSLFLTYHVCSTFQHDARIHRRCSQAPSRKNKSYFCRIQICLYNNPREYLCEKCICSMHYTSLLHDYFISTLGIFLSKFKE